jgi:enterochelin esterase-like enzyme
MFRTFEQAELPSETKGLLQVTVKSAALGRRADVTAFVPDDVSDLRNAPIVVLLHGVYGSHWAWSAKGQAHVTARRLMEQGRISPCVLLMPSDGLWGDGSGYLPHRDHDPEAFIVTEAPAIAARLTPSCSDSSPLYLAGLSMGGFAALRLAGKYPDRFVAVSGHSSATHQSHLAKIMEETTEGWSQQPADQDVVQALLHANGPLPRLRFDCGLDDMFLSANRNLHTHLQNAGIPHVYEELPGGHTWEYWQTNLERSLLFFLAQGQKKCG